MKRVLDPIGPSETLPFLIPERPDLIVLAKLHAGDLDKAMARDLLAFLESGLIRLENHRLVITPAGESWWDQECERLAEDGLCGGCGRPMYPILEKCEMVDVACVNPRCPWRDEHWCEEIWEDWYERTEAFMPLLIRAA